MKFSFVSLLLIILVGCTDQPENKDASERVSDLEVDYAKKFAISGTHLVVYEPWPGARDSITYPLSKTPKRVVVTSTTHLPYLELLGVEKSLVGFPNTGYIHSEKIRNLVEEGSITDLGPDGNINLELLLSLQPDIVFAFDMGKESASLDKISESGIPVVYNADYLETNALGRAEWIKFFGAFYNKEAIADSIFLQVSKRYDSLKNLATSIDEKPTILSGVLYGDTWFLPGGENWSGELFEDAGGQYLWSENESSGWLELSFESVFNKAQNADYWIGVSSFNSLPEIQNNDDRYAQFEAFKKENVFNYNKRLSPSGGYDFFESGYARPDLVLADLIKILHPEVIPDHELYYFQNLK